jgi:catechol 2,3-dioxygenase-like lactoylglutathione lyase family enzyme
MKGITGLGHVALKVKDIQRSLDFYSGKMGFKEMLRLNKDDGSLWLIYLRITDDQYLELFPDAPEDQAPADGTNGVNHYCLTVEGIESVVEAIVAAGIEIFRPLKTGADGNRQAWVKDPDGNRIELMEMSRDGLQAKAIERLRSAVPA